MCTVRGKTMETFSKIYYNTYKQVLLEEWNEISAKRTKSLVGSTINRLKAVLSNKGYPIKYYGREIFFSSENNIYEFYSCVLTLAV